MKNVFGIMIIFLMTQFAQADSIVIVPKGENLEAVVNASDAALARTRGVQVQSRSSEMRSGAAGIKAPLKEGTKARKPSKKLETTL